MFCLIHQRTIRAKKEFQSLTTILPQSANQCARNLMESAPASDIILTLLSEVCEGEFTESVAAMKLLARVMKMADKADLEKNLIDIVAALTRVRDYK